MATFAHFDPSSPEPHPVVGWFDTSLFAYPQMPPAGELLEVTPEQWAARMADPSGWQVTGGVLSAAAVVAPPAGSRTVSAAEFLALFTPAETAALWTADPLLMTGALKVMAQGSANLDSAEAATLLTLAVTKGVLTEAEKTRVLSGQPPTTANAS